MKNIFYIVVFLCANITYAGSVGKERQRNPVNIHIIAIGIDSYPQPFGSYKNCSSDAKALTDKILKNKTPYMLNKSNSTTRGFNKQKTEKDTTSTKEEIKVYTHLLLNEKATLSNIKSAFKQVIKNSTTSDYFVFYFGGTSLEVINSETILIPYLSSFDKGISTQDYNKYEHLDLVELASYMNQIASAKQLLISEAGNGKSFAEDLQSALFELDLELASNSERNRVILTTLGLGYDSTKCDSTHGLLMKYILDNGNVLDVFENYYDYEYNLNKSEVACSERDSKYYYLTQEKDYKKIIAKHLSKTATRGSQSKQLKKEKDNQLGASETYALVIATNVYNDNQTSWDNLKNPLNDANSISEVLENKYNVKVNKLYNEPRTAIKKGIIALKQQMDKNDKLIIFIAGHGYFSEDYSQGYIVPTDCESLDKDVTLDTYFSMSDLNSLLDGFSSKQVFTILDVCYGATFEINNADLPIENYANTKIDNGVERFIKEVDKSYSRIMLASGQQEVFDHWKEDQKHSPFASKLIKAFESEKEFISPGKIYSYVRGNTTKPILKKFGKHEVTGDFLLKVN